MFRFCHGLGLLLFYDIFLSFQLVVFYNIFLVIAFRPLRVSCSLWYYLVGVVAKGYITFAWRREVMVQTQWWFKTPQRWAFCCAGYRLSLIQRVKFDRLYRCFENRTGPAGWTRYTAYRVEICSGTDVCTECAVVTCFLAGLDRIYKPVVCLLSKPAGLPISHLVRWLTHYYLNFLPYLQLSTTPPPSPMTRWWPCVLPTVPNCRTGSATACICRSTFFSASARFLARISTMIAHISPQLPGRGCKGGCQRRRQPLGSWSGRNLSLAGSESRSFW